LALSDQGPRGAAELPADLLRVDDGESAVAYWVYGWDMMEGAWGSLFLNDRFERWFCTIEEFMEKTVYNARTYGLWLPR
jgi:hypothetical protein